MGCVEKGRGDGEGVEGITRAVARAKVGPSRSRASRSDKDCLKTVHWARSAATVYIKCHRSHGSNYGLTSL